MNMHKDIEARVRSFPNMPAFCAEVVARLNDQNVDFAILAEAMKYDPGITTNILHLANSAYFGLPQAVSSLHEAFVRIGTKNIMHLIIARGLAPILNRNLKGYGLRPDEFLRHSVWCAVASEEFCKAPAIAIPDTVFTAALIHDIGKIVLDDFVLQNLPLLLSNCRERKMPFHAAESLVLGINHAEVGAWILEQWRFPAALIAAVRWQHDPEKAADHATVVNLVHLSDILSYSSGIGVGHEVVRESPSAKALASLKVTPAILEQVAAQTMGKMQALHQLLAGQR